MHIDRPRSAAGAGIAAAVVLSLTVTPATAAPPVPVQAPSPTHYVVTTTPVRAAAGWLATQFVDRHLLPTPKGDRFVSGVYGGTTYLNYGENADVIFGLAATKSAQNKIATALRFLRAHVDDYTDIPNKDGYGPSDGAIGKLALAAVVAGANPAHFGGRNLMSTLKADECVSGSTTCTPGAAANIYSSISESFVVLAEARVGGAYRPSTRALAYFGSLQCADGGFTAGVVACGNGAADVDATSYAIMALQAAGGHAAALRSATSWLRAQQRPGGYWVGQQIANTNSTGLAAAALQGQGIRVTSARRWLRSQQVTRGHRGAGALRFDATITATTKTATSPSVLAIAQGLTALVRGGSLATVTAKGARSTIALFAPTAGLPASVHAGRRLAVSGTGFTAGEKVRVTIRRVVLGAATVGPLGRVRIRVTVPRSVGTGARRVVLTGRTSRLTARRTLRITAATGSAAGVARPGTSAR